MLNNKKQGGIFCNTLWREVLGILHLVMNSKGGYFVFNDGKQEYVLCISRKPVGICILH